MRRAVTIGAFLLLAVMVGRAQAELFDRGNGLIYESVFDLSWTQNAALSGLNDWASQKTFADNLVLAGFDDFILATRGDLESLYIRLPGADGSNKTGNQGPFVGIQSTYWSRTETAPGAPTAWVVSFLGGDEAPGDKNFTRYGWAVRFGDSQRLGGGVPVPAAATALLLGIGIVGLSAAERWRAAARVSVSTQPTARPQRQPGTRPDED